MSTWHIIRLWSCIIIKADTNWEPSISTCILPSLTAAHSCLWVNKTGASWCKQWFCCTVLCGFFFVVMNGGHTNLNQRHKTPIPGAMSIISTLGKFKVLTTNKTAAMNRKLMSHTINNYLPACEHDHKSLCDCQTLDAFDTACHRVHSRSWL